MQNPLLLLHGAIGAADQMTHLKKALRRPFHPYVFDFPGHGKKDLPDEPFSIRLFAKEVVRFMDKKKIPVADIFGYSLGGYVGLYLARHYPERTGKVMTLATKFAWDPDSAEREIKLLDPVRIMEKVPRFAEALKKRHAGMQWEVVLKNTADLIRALGKDPELKDGDFELIVSPVLVAVGDRDTMVTLEETLYVSRIVTAAQLAVLPGAPHSIEQMDQLQVAEVARRFFTEEILD
ncbi:MAG TPA: alpha/beta hydrolase [Bacteroidia bacterium]|nr:alpha/beta hydrolase [Bacteroidia bacterium]